MSSATPIDNIKPEHLKTAWDVFEYIQAKPCTNENVRELPGFWDLPLGVFLDKIWVPSFQKGAVSSKWFEVLSASALSSLSCLAKPSKDDLHMVLTAMRWENMLKSERLLAMGLARHVAIRAVLSDQDRDWWTGAPQWAIEALAQIVHASRTVTPENGVAVFSSLLKSQMPKKIRSCCAALAHLFEASRQLDFLTPLTPDTSNPTQDKMVFAFHADPQRLIGMESSDVLIMIHLMAGGVFSYVSDPPFDPVRAAYTLLSKSPCLADVIMRQSIGLGSVNSDFLHFERYLKSSSSEICGAALAQACYAHAKDQTCVDFVDLLNKNGVAPDPVLLARVSQINLNASLQQDAYVSEKINDVARRKPFKL